MKTSKISKFYEKSIEERLALIKDFAELTDEEVTQLKQYSCLNFEQADRMIENVFSTFSNTSWNRNKFCC